MAAIARATSGEGAHNTITTTASSLRCVLVLVVTVSLHLVSVVDCFTTSSLFLLNMLSYFKAQSEIVLTCAAVCVANKPQSCLCLVWRHTSPYEMILNPARSILQSAFPLLSF